MRILLAVALGLLPVALSVFVLWRRKLANDIPRWRLIFVIASTAALAWLCQFAELGLWELTGLSLVAEPGKESEALLAMFLFAAPLEEGAKVLGIWPFYRARRLYDVRHAIVFSALSGVGFAAGKLSVLVFIGDGSGLSLLRALACVAPHVVCAVMWGATLGVRATTGWFALAWLLATLLRGGFDHIVFGRGPGVMILGLPLLLSMLGLCYAFARRAAAREQSLVPSIGTRARALGGGSGIWSEPPSVREMWRQLQPKQEPLMVHWIGLGTLVTAGLGMCALALALYVGHALGVDFAAADEADVRSNGPLFFLATAVGAAFPVAGYLVARASGTHSVLEPALGAALAVLGGVLFLSVTTPIAAVFALALAPIAFVLASGGAWFGIAR
ncbi:MAG TPA: PrsW family glutamic-type intramembrane protease [Polyangiaceae bacterium]|nr:PrsW family glutamic-type intramembrane protease [Polyangiaceae bacterium]